MPVNAIFKYDDPRLDCQHADEASLLTLTVQPWDIIFHYHMNKYVLSDGILKFKKDCVRISRHPLCSKLAEMNSTLHSIKQCITCF